MPFIFIQYCQRTPMNLDSQELNEYISPPSDSSFSHELFLPTLSHPPRPPRLGLISPSSSKEPEPTRDLTVIAPPLRQPLCLEVPLGTAARRRQISRGRKNDTMELNINFKTLLLAHLRTLRALRELTHPQNQHVEAFARRPPSFASLTAFFRGEGSTEALREHCRGFLEGARCVRGVLGGRASMRTKLSMVKFVERVGATLRGRTCKWKDSV